MWIFPFIMSLLLIIPLILVVYEIIWCVQFWMKKKKVFVSVFYIYIFCICQHCEWNFVIQKWNGILLGDRYLELFWAWVYYIRLFWCMIWEFLSSPLSWVCFVMRSVINFILIQMGIASISRRNLEKK